MTKKIKLVPSLQAHWFELCKLYVEGRKLHAEGCKLYVEADNLYDKANKIYAEARKIHEEGESNFSAAVAAVSGPKTRVHWTRAGCTVGEGPDAKTYLFAEPL